MDLGKGGFEMPQWWIMRSWGRGMDRLLDRHHPRALSREKKTNRGLVKMNPGQVVG